MNTHENTRQEQLEQGLRAWARGITSVVAGVELLIRHERAVYPRAPWIREYDNGLSEIDTDRLLEETGAHSAGEQRIFKIAASLIGGHPVDLSDALCGLDHKHADLVLAAVASAAGFDDTTTSFDFDEEGHPHRVQLPGLYGWPGHAETLPLTPAQ